MDNFEKYIAENKDSFNEHKADRKKLWSNIEQELDKKPAPKVFKLWKSPIMKVAASIFIVLGLFSVISFFMNGGINPGQNDIVNQELEEIDMYYSSMVTQQVQLVKLNTKLSQEDKDEFLSFMDELDTEYKELRIEMKENLDNELVLAAIVNNYKKRIELIEKLLERINNSKNIEDGNGYIL
ncbi:sugar-specific transcriptional regulator TrmB [Saonia flava]|uniref:Sugar-specific transcriptional regulator TrmB n=1 Tax=Saonia flava TaxID=523696 RepID=A0A846QLG3_9FLAO|nr:hypothetical protein [Saonia flava]NJB69796.1 sugar-specific transcriptional regulator TrmB [Saonia flava]